MCLCLGRSFESSVEEREDMNDDGRGMVWCAMAGWKALVDDGGFDRLVKGVLAEPVPPGAGDCDDD